jgi:DNA-binding protein HU-beta
MNKAELIAAISKDCDLSKAEATRALDSITNRITQGLKKGENITLVGFGTFSVTKRKARLGRNPQTGQTIQIKAKKVPKFKAGSELVKAIGR